MRELILLGLGLLMLMALLTTLAQRLRIPTPLFLVVGGLLVSLIPGVPRIRIEPDLIFLVFLPPLLYEAAWAASWRELWHWRRIVLVLAFGLVVVTATAVAYTATWFIPGFTLALGFVLGGIVSPPDAVSATSVLKNVNVPRSLRSILEGESLINDAASLIVLRFALDYVQTGQFVWQQVAVSFVLVAVLGAVVGLLVALVFYVIHRYLSFPPSIGVLLTLITPYAMYLAAEQFHYSGVIAVVSGGLFMSARRHEILQHTERVQGVAMWTTLVFATNGIVFTLIGLELPIILGELNGHSLTDALGYALLISAVVIVVRLGFSLVASKFTDFVGKFIPVAVRNVGWRGPVVLGWAGMRGVVSLAAAFSIPLTLTNGTDFPNRPLLLFITFVVILVTLLVQGATLPLVIRWLNPPDLMPRLPEYEQQKLIRRHLREAALTELTKVYNGQLTTNPLLDELKRRIENVAIADQLTDSPSDQALREQHHRAMNQLHRAKQEKLAELRHRDDLDDEVIRKIQAQLDLEQERNEPSVR